MHEIETQCVRVAPTAFSAMRWISRSAQVRSTSKVGRTIDGCKGTFIPVFPLHGASQPSDHPDHEIRSTRLAIPTLQSAALH